MSSAVVPSFSSDLMIVHGIVQQMGATGAAKADIAALHRRAQIAEQSCAANPEYSAVVFDYGGRLALAARDFAGAYSAFLEAFKAFESSGSPRKIGCIKLCVVAKMLSNSAIKCAADKFLKSWHSSELIHAISHCCSSVTTLSHNRGAGGDIIIFDFLFACAPAPADIWCCRSPSSRSSPFDLPEMSGYTAHADVGARRRTLVGNFVSIGCPVCY